MGFNTVVLILNDAMHNLKTDPNVGEKLYNAMGESQHPANKDGVEFSIGNHCNGGMVLPSRHADEVQIVAVGGNYMKRVGVLYHADMEDPEAMVRRLADSLGYRLVKKAAR